MPPTADSGPHRLFRKQAGAEPLPGYRLLEPLGRGGFGEVWKCEAPGGLLKAIKFVYPDSDADDAPGDSTESSFGRALAPGLAISLIGVLGVIAFAIAGRRTG